MSVGKNKKLGLTHKALDARFRTLGRGLVSRVEGTPPTTALKAPDASFKSDRFKRIYEAAKAGNLARILAPKTFGAHYRGRLPKHDELISTSSVRAITHGILDEALKHPLSLKANSKLDGILNNISKVRFPTRYSGFANSREFMQHPTARGEGLFGDPTKTARSHARLDLARKEAVAAEMERARQLKNATGKSVAEAGLRTAIAFTLNEFTAPITARDVQPFSAAAKRSPKDPDLLEQVRGRERLKDVFVRLGGRRERPGNGGTDYRRKWTQRQGRGLRDVSPARAVRGV